MDRLSTVMVRASFAWLLLGVVFGALLLTDRALPGEWRLWLQPTHGHVLFVGWFLQFALGVAYWLLPRRRSPARPLGYREWASLTAVVALNLGLGLRLVGEPADRAAGGPSWTVPVLAVSAILQVAAVAVFVGQLWPRVATRPGRTGRPASAGSATDQRRP